MRSRRGAGRAEPPPRRAARAALDRHVDRRRAWSCSRSPTSRSTRSARTRRARAACGPGEPLPPFAAPLALSRLDGDANLATSPARAQGDRRGLRRCAARTSSTRASSPSAGPVALAFFATRSAALRRAGRRRSSACARASRDVSFAACRDPRRPRRGCGARAQARLDAAGRPTTTTARSPTSTRVAVCPTDHVRARAAAGSRARAVALDGRGAGARAWSAEASGAVSAEPPLVEAGSRPSVAAEFPGLRLLAARRSPRARAAARRRCASGCALLSDRFRGAAGDRAAPPADPARLPRLLPPHRARPRRAPHRRSRRSRRAPEARRLPLAHAARRRADDRGDGDRRAGVGARRRPGARAATVRGAPPGRGTARCPPGGSWSPTPRPRRGALRRRRGGARGDAAHPRDGAVLGRGARRASEYTSRRRSGPSGIPSRATRVGSVPRLIAPLLAVAALLAVVPAASAQGRAAVIGATARTQVMPSPRPAPAPALRVRAGPHRARAEHDRVRGQRSSSPTCRLHRCASSRPRVRRRQTSRAST